MKDIIRERLRADVRRAVAEARAQIDVPHRGLRGRFRELLLNDLLAPWLPPYAGCSTGMIVDAEGHHRKATQEDIVIFDRSLVPPVLVSHGTQEGMFPAEGVLCRVEVKSRLTASELRSAIDAAIEVEALEPAKWSRKGWPPPMSYLFAYESDLKGDAKEELTRLLDVSSQAKGAWVDGFPSPPLRGLCVVGRGCWMFGGHHTSEKGAWYQAIVKEEHDEAIFFVGIVSNTCFECHLMRQGRSPGDSIEMGIGPYVLQMGYHRLEVTRHGI